MLSLSLAWANLFRQKRRTLITGITLLVGLSAVNLFQGYKADTLDSLAETSIYGEYLGHLVVMKKDALIQGKIDEAEYMFDGPELEKVLAVLRGAPEVEIATPRLELSGLVSNGKNSVIFLALALEPEVFRQFQDHFEWRGTGQPLDPAHADGGMFAQGLARILDVKLDQILTIFSTTVENRLNAVDVVARGVYPTGSTATDDKFMIVPLKLGRRLYRTDGASKVAVVLNEGVTVAQAREVLAERLAETGLDLEIRDWREMSAFFRGVEDIYRMIFGFLFLIVLVVVLMGVFNTMTMAAMERTREIGMLRALGMTPGRLRTVFALEGGILGLAAGLGSIVLSAAAAAAINNAGITYTPPGVSGAVRLVVDVLPGPFIGNALTVAVLAALISLLPAYFAARRSIVEALRHS